MMGYTASLLQQIGVGRVFCALDQLSVLGAVTDSRQAGEELAFIARRGEQLDGHNFIEDALGRGCRMLLLEEGWASAHPQQLALWQGQGLTILLPQDSDQALLRWAVWQRQRLTTTKLLAVTGSYGKTTTKHLIYSCLAPYLKVSCAPRNWNSLAGVALSLLQVDPASEVAVLECGIDHCGEMAEIAGLLRPHQVLVTAVGVAHLQGLSNEETVAYEKSRLFQQLEPSGVVFLPCDDPWFDYLVSQIRQGSVLGFGRQLRGWGGYHDLGLDGGLLRLGQEELTLPLHSYKERGLQAAVAVGRYWGLSDGQLLAGLRNFTAIEGRGEVQRGRYTVLQESYNAPKDSVISLLQWLGQRATDQRRYFVVLGDVLELGAVSAQHHREIGALCPRQKNISYFFIGEEMRQAYQSYCQHSRDQACWCADAHEVVDRLGEQMQPGDVLVLKGSRGMRLEQVLQFLNGREASC